MSLQPVPPRESLGAACDLAPEAFGYTAVVRQEVHLQVRALRERARTLLAFVRFTAVRRVRLRVPHEMRALAKGFGAAGYVTAEWPFGAVNQAVRRLRRGKVVGRDRRWRLGLLLFELRLFELRLFELRPVCEGLCVRALPAIGVHRHVGEPERLWMSIRDCPRR